jgi:hypothetical protein
MVYEGEQKATEYVFFEPEIPQEGDPTIDMPYLPPGD